MSNFSHLNEKNNPKMVNVSDKKITKRTAIAKATMFLGKEIIAHFNNEELITKKGQLFLSLKTWLLLQWQFFW